jgi:deoxyinosine 3'endonuclease (endonuclease V)
MGDSATNVKREKSSVFVGNLKLSQLRKPAYLVRKGIPVEKINEELIKELVDEHKRQLSELLSVFGSVVSIRWMQNYCFVKYSNSNEAALAFGRLRQPAERQRALAQLAPATQGLEAATLDSEFRVEFEKEVSDSVKHRRDYPIDVREKWKIEQLRLRQQLVTVDSLEFDPNTLKGLRLVAGVDISFVKNNNVDACASLVVLEYPSLRIVYERYKMVELTLPYISTFLAFREVPFLVDLVQELRVNSPNLVPQAILVDGNGFLHPRGFGLACHLGVLTGLPTIGIGKTLLFVDGVGIELARSIFEENCHKAGDYAPLVGASGTVWGATFKSSDKSAKPIYVSIGHRISLDTACRLTARLCRVRIPEPVRRADLGSREYIRRNVQ